MGSFLGHCKAGLGGSTGISPQAIAKAFLLLYAAISKRYKTNETIKKKIDKIIIIQVQLGIFDPSKLFFCCSKNTA